jgi:iron(III) transport system substrate-binding protein
MRFLSSGTRAARGLGAVAFGVMGFMSMTALSSPAHAADTIVLYSAQHEQTVNMLVADFTKETGIEVKVHSGDGPEVANQIIEEGGASPADVFFTENSPEITVLSEKGLMAPVAKKTLAMIPAKYSAPDGTWVGVLARENVLAYNPSMLPEGQLPKSLLDLADPAWKGKVAIAPSDNDFLPLVQAVLVTKGKDGALAWLKGLKANAQVFDDDEGVVAAVNRGAVASGVINNYYWSRLAVEQGAANTHSTVYHFTNGDVGGLINISGAGVLKSSKHQEAAQRFVAYLVAKRTQTLLAKKSVDFEYPLHPGVAPNATLKPFKELQPPAIGITQLGDDAAVPDLLRAAGLI